MIKRSPPLACIILSLLLLLSISRPLTLIAQTRVSWYASNGVGMKNRGITPEDAGKYKWVLKQIMSQKKENIYLYKEGEEYRHVEREFNSKNKIISEKLFLGGKISEKKIFDSNGDIEKKWNYNEKGTVETRTNYNYSPLPRKQLLSIEIFNNAGEKINEDFFSLRNDGSLRKLVRHKQTARSIPDISIQGRRRSGTGFSSSYSSIDGIKKITLFDKEGRVEKEEQYKGEKLTRTTIWNYKEKTNIKTRCVKNNIETGRKTLLLYNNKGLLLSEKITEHGIFKERTTYRYNGLEQIVEKHFKTTKETGRILYQYREEDVSLETIYKGNELYSKIYYISAKKRIEEKYRDNEIILKIHYVNGVKVLDQFFLDGEMIREKKYR